MNNRKSLTQVVIQALVPAIASAVLAAASVIVTVQLNIAKLEKQMDSLEKSHRASMETILRDIQDLKSGQSDLFQKYYVPSKMEWSEVQRDIARNTIMFEQLDKKLDRIANGKQ